jgi:magnesium chelatase family protein
LDRIDLQVEVARVPYKDLARTGPAGTPSEKIRERVLKARRIQQERLDGTASGCNARMGVREILQHCAPDKEGLKLLEAAFERLKLSARAYHRILKVGRTIADLEGSERIRPAHLAEAVQYRLLDRSQDLH